MLKNILLFAPNIGLSLAFILLTFGVLDGVWLGFIAKSWYQAEMAGLLRTEFITWPWVAFYVLYSVVIFVLAVVANRDKSALYASIDGALLGLASYGAYNLTNYSIMQGFSLKIMLLDWCWGIFISAICALSGWYGFQCLRRHE